MKTPINWNSPAISARGKYQSFIIQCQRVIDPYSQAYAEFDAALTRDWQRHNYEMKEGAIAYKYVYGKVSK